MNIVLKGTLQTMYNYFPLIIQQIRNHLTSMLRKQLFYCSNFTTVRNEIIVMPFQNQQRKSGPN